MQKTMKIPENILFLKNRTIISSASRYLSKEYKNTTNQKDICTPVFIITLITIAKIWKQLM